MKKAEEVATAALKNTVDYCRDLSAASWQSWSEYFGDVKRSVVQSSSFQYSMLAVSGVTMYYSARYAYRTFKRPTRGTPGRALFEHVMIRAGKLIESKNPDLLPRDDEVDQLVREISTRLLKMDQTLCVHGPKGVGKTTLLKMMMKKVMQHAYPTATTQQYLDDVGRDVVGSLLARVGQTPHSLPYPELHAVFYHVEFNDVLNGQEVKTLVRNHFQDIVQQRVSVPFMVGEAREAFERYGAEFIIVISVNHMRSPDVFMGLVGAARELPCKVVLEISKFNVPPHGEGSRLRQIRIPALREDQTIALVEQLGLGRRQEFIDFCCGNAQVIDDVLSLNLEPSITECGERIRNLLPDGQTLLHRWYTSGGDADQQFVLTITDAEEKTAQILESERLVDMSGHNLRILMPQVYAAVCDVIGSAPIDVSF